MVVVGVANRLGCHLPRGVDQIHIMFSCGRPTDYYMPIRHATVYLWRVCIHEFSSHMQGNEDYTDASQNSFKLFNVNSLTAG